MAIADTRKMTSSLHRYGRQAAAAAAVSLGVLLLLPTVAGAAFPGTNGDVAFVTTRGDNVNIEQVDPTGSGIGTPSGDLANTTALTAGSIDAEPFYSPDGTQVVFSSNRSGRWAIYQISQTDTNESVPATEISQTSGHEAHDDYGPSFSDDGSVVVFNRDLLGIYSIVLSDGVSSACDLYNPTGGLATPSSDGSSSRIVFDPADPTKLVYVAGNNQIHLLSGIVLPTAGTPCPTEPGLTDINLSTTATPTGTSTGTPADDNPDWRPDGSTIIFDSTRNGGHSLWYFSNPTSGSPTVTALWPTQTGPSGTSDTQPVFSPDGTHIAYTQPQPGTQVIDYESNTFGAPLNSETDLTLGAGSSANSQPDWQPAGPGNGTPEAPAAVLLPGAGLLIGGGYVLIRNRRRLSLRTVTT